MSQAVMICLLGGALSGLLTLAVEAAALRWIARRSARDVDLENVYENMDSLKHDLVSDRSPDESGTSPALRLVLLSAVVSAGVMAAVLWFILSMTVETTTAAVILAFFWSVITFTPVLIVNSRKSRRIAVLELASVLELVALSESEMGEKWAITAQKMVTGGDLFGEEEQDLLTLRISRTEVAPTKIMVAGRVAVAEAGIGRTVSKSGLRELRLKGWFVNELSETEAEIGLEWGLKETSYAEISSCVSEAIERLGFSLRNVRLSQIDEPPAPSVHSDASVEETLEAQLTSAR